MRSYALLLLKQPRKYLAAAPRPLRERLDRALTELCQEPRGQDCRPLQGDLAGLWRKREGGWRIIYTIDDAQRQLTVNWIGARGDAY